MAARYVRDEEAAGSNPASPTRNHQVRVAVFEKIPTLIPLSGLSGEILEKILDCSVPALKCHGLSENGTHDW